MIIGIPEILLGLALFVLPIACLVNWVAAFRQVQDNEPLVPSEYEENVPWGLADLAVVMLIVAVTIGAGVYSIAKMVGIENPDFSQMIDPRDQGRLFLIFGCASLLATAFTFGWLFTRYRIRVFPAANFGPDIELGMRWFVMLVVPVLLIQLVLTQFFSSEHPLTEMLRLTKNPSLLPIAAFVAMISAPIFEEMFFRMLLQGWLEKLQVTASRMKAGIGTKADSDAVLLGGHSSASMLSPEEQQALEEEDANPFSHPPGNGSSEKKQSGDNPYEASAALEKEDDGDVIAVVEDRPIMWVPILVSSGLFAIAHLQHGPDWVPLFFLAVGIGYLYQRTRRVLPCIVVHMLVNGLGVLQLWYHVRH